MSDHDSAETESSICEEERLRRLFYLCDENGDGYIDSHDLLSMCKQLEMENAFEQILADLGGNQDGLISLEDFVRRGLNVHACHDFSSTAAVAEKRRAFETNVSLSNQLSDVEEFDSGFLVTSGASNSIPTSCESLSNGQKVESWKRDLPTCGGSNVRSLPASGENSRTNSFGRQRSSGGVNSPHISGTPGSYNPKTSSKNSPHLPNTSPRLGGRMNNNELVDFSGRLVGAPRGPSAAMFLGNYGHHHEHPPGSPKGIQITPEQNINNLQEAFSRLPSESSEDPAVKSYNKSKRFALCQTPVGMAPLKQRDLSPRKVVRFAVKESLLEEPQKPHKPLPVNITAPQMDKANDSPLHLAALASMRQDINDLNCKLQTLVEEKDGLEKQLIGVQREKDLLSKECQRKLESQSMRYEERITELHGVIFEINKQYDRLHGDTIREEDEEEFEENEAEEDAEDEQTSHSNSSTSLVIQKHRPSTNSSNSFLANSSNITHSQRSPNSAVTGNNACSLLKQAIAKAETTVNQSITEQLSLAASASESKESTSLGVGLMTNKRASPLGVRSDVSATTAAQLMSRGSSQCKQEDIYEAVDLEALTEEDAGDPYTVEVDALEDEEGQNVYYELNAEAEEGDTAEVLDKVPLVTSLDNKGVTAGGRNRVPLISKRRTPASANMSASMANLLEDDSVILDLERQTAMACKELETLEISNTSRSALKTTTTGQLKVATPHAPLGGASPGVGEKSPQQKRLTSVSGHSSSLTSPTGHCQPAVPKLSEQLRIHERSISDLEVQLTLCKKENTNLQYLLSMSSQEKQKMITRISELEQNLSQLMLVGAATGGGIASNLVPNSNLHPNGFEVFPNASKNADIIGGSFTQLGKFASKTLPKSSTCKGYDYNSCNDLPPSTGCRDASALVPPPLPPPRMASLDSTSQGRTGNQQQMGSSSSLHGYKSMATAPTHKHAESGVSTLQQTAYTLLPPGATATTTSSVQSLVKSSSEGTAAGIISTPVPTLPVPLTHQDQPSIRSDVSADRIMGLELQLEKSESQVGRMQSEIDLLQLTLEESKSTSERLAMLCGKYESNNTALRMTMDYADLCIEALESLLALAATDLNPVKLGAGPTHNAINNNSLTCNILSEASDYEDEYGMLGIATALQHVTEEEQQLVKQRRHNRRQAEAAAKAILSHLDSTLARVNRVVMCGPAVNDRENQSRASSVRSNNSARSNPQYSNNGGAPAKTGGSGGSGSNPNVFTAAGDDWSSQGRTSTTSSTNSATSTESDWSKLDENRLKDYIAQLKSERAAVRLTILELESIYADPDISSQMKLKRQKQHPGGGVSVSSSGGNSPQNSNQSSLKVSSRERDKWREESEDMLAAFESQRQDLEYAVLTQELMTLKEEKAELRAQMYLTEKEKKQMACMQSSQESQLKAYALQVEQLKEQLEGKRGHAGQFMGDAEGSTFTSSLQELSSKTSTVFNQHTSLSGFSTLSSTASCAKSDPLYGSEHASSCPSAAGTGGVIMTSQPLNSCPSNTQQQQSTATPIITLEQLSSVAGGAAAVGHHVMGASAMGDSARGVVAGQGSAVEPGSAAGGMAMSVEARRKEQKMKQRIQELSNALETLSKHCDAKDKQTSEYIADLKRANSALIAAYDKAKKKHSSRLKKLESQMKAMCERHDTTVKMLRQRISLLEEQEKKNSKLSVSSTSGLTGAAVAGVSSHNSSLSRGVTAPSETCL